MAGGIFNEMRLAARSLWNEGPIGKKVVEHFEHEPLDTVGYHGTRLSKVEGQLEQGKLENQDKDIYFVPKGELVSDIKAAFWAGNHDDAIIIELGSNQPTLKNKAFNTHLFPKGENQDVKVIRAWKVSPEWKKETWDHAEAPSLVEKISNSVKSFFDS